MEKQNAKIIVGQAIKKKRKERGITQKKISNDTGMSRSYICDVENGRYMPSLLSFIKIASYLEIDLNFLHKLTEISYKKEALR